MADRIQISRLFTNLITNAIEAGLNPQSNVQILIKQVVSNNQVMVCISDQSGGIADELKQHLFTPNFTTKTSGTGLGLAICKGIVEQANGKIWFETQEGLGTSFFVQIPLAQNA